MNMTHDSLPFEHIYNLGSLGRAGDEVVVSARGDELQRIADWAEVRRVESFSATVSLQKLSAARFTYDADMRAEIVQDCVVTLEPVRSLLERKIHRELHLTETRRPPADSDVLVDPVADEDDVLEEISNLHYDLAGPLLEELILAIDPYPRAPGVAFSPPPDPGGQPESPFAVLKNLKKPG
ncbi:MAG: YceD family protein [Rhizomicrobium sp.]